MATKQLFITDRKAVRESFGKTDKDVVDDINTIRKWVETQPHLPEVPSDNMIEILLLNNQFSIENTKQTLDMYYTIRSRMPQFYEDSNPQSPLMRAVPDKMCIFVTLPKQTMDHHRIFVLKYLKYSECLDINKLIAHILNVMEVYLQNDVTAGNVCIIDHENFHMGHVVKTTAMHMKNAATILEKVFSNKLKGLYLINNSTFVDKVLFIWKTVLSPKMFERIKIHQNIEELYRYIPRELLPKEYGGDQESIEKLNDLWKDCFKENAARFDKLDNMKVKEELRPTPLDNDEVLGYHGNFKKLDVD